MESVIQAPQRRTLLLTLLAALTAGPAPNAQAPPAPVVTLFGTPSPRAILE